MEGIQEIQITEAFHYNARTKTFVAEASDIRAYHTETLWLFNPKTGCRMFFRFYRADGEKGNIQGWHYFSTEGFKFLLIND